MRYKSIILIALLISSLSVFGELVAFDETMAKISDPYFKIHNNLSSDTVLGNIELAETMLPLVMELKKSKIPEEHQEHYKTIPENMIKALKKLKSSKEISDQRDAFKELSKPMAMWASMAKPGDINVVYCSMAPGSWLQQDEKIRNPYYGASMLKCGEIISSGEKDVKAVKTMHEMHGN